MSWMSAERTELAAERILDAAAQLFMDQGVGLAGMEDVARAAGCSRATVYRHFENKPALLRAFVHREARDITGQVAEQIRALPSGSDAFVEAVVATLAAVRARPYLQVWYQGADATELAEVFRESSVIPALAGGFLAPADSEPDRDRGAWILRIVMSFLREPGESPQEERRLLATFLHIPRPSE